MRYGFSPPAQATEEFVLQTCNSKRRDKSQHAKFFFEVSPLYIGLYSLKSFQGCFSFLFFLVFNHRISMCLHVQDLGGRGASVAFWYSLGVLGQCCLLPLVLGPAWCSAPGRTEIWTSQAGSMEVSRTSVLPAQNRSTCTQTPEPETPDLPPAPGTLSAPSAVVIALPPSWGQCTSLSSNWSKSCLVELSGLTGPPEHLPLQSAVFRTMYVLPVSLLLPFQENFLPPRRWNPW